MHQLQVWLLQLYPIPGLAALFGQNDAGLPPSLDLMDTMRVVVAFADCAVSGTLVPYDFSGICQLCHGFFLGTFFWKWSRCSVWTHFSLQPGCEDYYFIDKTVAEHGFNSVLTNTSERPKVDICFDKFDATTSPVCSGFKSHKMWCQIRVLPYLACTPGRQHVIF